MSMEILKGRAEKVIGRKFRKSKSSYDVDDIFYQWDPSTVTPIERICWKKILFGFISWQYLCQFMNFSVECVCVCVIVYIYIQNLWLYLTSFYVSIIFLYLVSPIFFLFAGFETFRLYIFDVQSRLFLHFHFSNLI